MNETHLRVKDIDWLKYLQVIFADVDVDISSSEPVVVFASSFLRQLGDIRLTTPTRSVCQSVGELIGRSHAPPRRFALCRLDFDTPLSSIATLPQSPPRPVLGKFFFWGGGTWPLPSPSLPFLSSSFLPFPSPPSSPAISLKVGTGK